MKFQIKLTKDYLRTEQSRILKMIDRHDYATVVLKMELTMLDKCRGEINKANELIS